MAFPTPATPWPVLRPYPPSRTSPHAENFHGVTVADPFRWLETNDSPEVRAWADAQNRLTNDVLDKCPDRTRIADALHGLWAHRRASLPVTAGAWSFHLAADGLQNQPVLYATLEGTERALIDPNAIEPDGTLALTGWTASHDGTYVAYALSRNGTDRQEIRIRRSGTGADLSEVLLFGKSEEDLPYGNLAWHPDGSGFYYPRLPDPETVPRAEEYRNCQLFWHQLGTPQSADRLIYERPDDPDLNFVPIVTGDGRFLVLHLWKGLSHRHQMCYRPLDGDGNFENLFPSADARYLFLGSRGDQFLFHTNADAPHGRIIAVDLARPAREDWEELIFEGPHAIDSAAWFGEKFVVTYICGGHHEVSLYGASGGPGTAITLPGRGRVIETGFDEAADHVLLLYESILQPPTILRFGAHTGLPAPQAMASLPIDANAFLARHDHVTTADGTRLPITLVHRRDLLLNGQTPLLLYGYGGFNVNITPTYDASRLVWLQNGGIYAFVNLRGGGEFGEDWHHAGALACKQTVFNDFIASAEWVIGQGLTDAAHLAICGESNGGLLVAACMLQRPDLFAAVVCSIPVTDMLRYPNFTIGAYWIPEYGDARADANAFATLSAYSPLHNVRPDTVYPGIILTTGMQDDRVVPAHAFKLVATLQHVSASGSGPALLRVQSNVGHGLGKPTNKVLELDTDIYLFLFLACGVQISA